MDCYLDRLLDRWVGGIIFWFPRHTRDRGGLRYCITATIVFTCFLADVWVFVVMIAILTCSIPSHPIHHTTFPSSINPFCSKYTLSRLFNHQRETWDYLYYYQPNQTNPNQPNHNIIEVPNPHSRSTHTRRFSLEMIDPFHAPSRFFIIHTARGAFYASGVWAP